MNESEKIIAWLKVRELIKIRLLEKLAGTAEGDIAKAIAGTRPLQERHVGNLKAILIQYGYK